MQRATQSPQPERLYERLDACASGLAEAALEQATLSLTVVTHEAAAGAQDCSPAEPARAGVAPSGLAAGGPAQAPADLPRGLGSTAEPGAHGLDKAEPAGLASGAEQLWDCAALAREAAAGASPGRCTPQSSRAGVLEDRESSCELGRASSGSGAGSPASDAALCRSSNGQRSCDDAAWRAAAESRVQPSQGPCGGFSPDPNPEPGHPPASPRSNSCVAAASSAAWELSPKCDSLPERRRRLSRSACELGDASSSADGDVPAALPAAPNGLRDSDKENMAAAAAAWGLGGSRGGVGLSADSGGLGREGALLASEFAGLGLLTGFQGALKEAGAPAGDSSPGAAGGAWGMLQQPSSATLTDPGSQPPMHGALSEETAQASSQACQGAAAGPEVFCSGVALGSGEACGEAMVGMQSQSGAASPAAGRGSLPGTEFKDADASAACERAANDACGEQCMGSAGVAAAVPERSACEARAHPAGEQALPWSQTLQPLPGSGARPEAGAARSDCGSADGDPNSGSRVSGSGVVRDGAVPMLSSSTELVPLEFGATQGGAGLLRAADEPGEVQSAPEAGSRGRAGAPAARRSLDGAWGVPPTELVPRCGALVP